jgi:hypothetical protein
MPTSPSTPNPKLAALLEREAAIKAKIAALQSREKAQARKDETRLKILVGAAFLADAELNPATGDIIREVLQRAITLDRDRDFLKSKGWWRDAATDSAAHAMPSTKKTANE